MNQWCPAESHSVLRLAELVRADRPAILAAWQARIRNLAALDGPSLGTQGGRILDWLASSLDGQARDREPSTLHGADCFSAPRAIAELALLTETIGALQPTSIDQAARDALDRVIASAIAESLARDNEESERLRTRLQLATNLALVGCWELESVTGAASADPRARDLFGIGPGELSTVDGLTSRLHADDRVRVREGIANTAGSGQPYVDDCRALRLDDGGHRWIAIAANAHQRVHASAPAVLGIVQDITDRKRSEEEQARVVDELSRAVHISEMFVGILSHDLRNPLSAILGGAQLLGAEVKDPKSARILSLVINSGERMGRMIEQLLDFTRVRLGEGIPLDRDRVDLADLAREIVAEGKSANPSSSLRVSALGDTAGPWDRDRIFQVVSNLVGNALQHGTASGNIDVVIDGRTPDSVTLAVENQGAIPAHLLPVIFNPFRGTLQKRGKSKGLGLGLYVARQIVLAHGGKLQVEATSTGTVFTMTLPRSVADASPPSHDFVDEDELAAFERMAAPPSTSAVTAQLFGATPLHDRAPLEHSAIVESYASLLDTALHRKAYRGQGEGLAEDLRVLAERLGDLGAGPREVTEVHARALRHAVRGATAAKTQALLSEGRLLALELMGNLASYYRRRSRGQVRGPSGGRS